MSETKELALVPASVDPAAFFSQSQMELIHKTIAPKATPDELRLFLYQAARTGLDPLSKQIYAIHRNEYNPDTRQKEPKMTIQTSIDGLRLIAERTGRYAPGPETTFEYAEDRLVKATAYVKKYTKDGQWHTVAASAHFREYAQTYQDKPTRMWAEKPHVMLSKCAEALALRRAFPAEMSGVYSTDEMAKADDEPAEYTPPAAKEAAPATSPKASSDASTAAKNPSTAASSTAPAAELASTSDAPAMTDGPTLRVVGRKAVPIEPHPMVEKVKEVFGLDKPGKDAMVAMAKLAMANKPNGLGWSKPHFANWLKKHFNADGLASLNGQQFQDAEWLLRERLKSEDEYVATLSSLAAIGRCAV